MSENNDEKKDIEVVEGIGNLDISPVYNHLSGSKPKMQDEKPKNIVIPQVKKLAEEEKDIVSENEVDFDEDNNLDNESVDLKNTTNSDENSDNYDNDTDFDDDVDLDDENIDDFDLIDDFSIESIDDDNLDDDADLTDDID